MIRTCILTGAALLLSAGAASAQDAGGVGFPNGISPANLAQAFAQPARLPVFANPQRRGAPPGAMVTNPGVSRNAVHQQAITKIRGDAGFLGGFDKGKALAASRAEPQPFNPGLTFIDAPFIVNNFNSALNFAFGDGNVAGQQVATDAGGTATPAHPSPPPPTAQTVPAPPSPPHSPKASPIPKPPTPPSAPDLLTTAGPLPHLPIALEKGGVQFNNVNSTINMAAGRGNFAGQNVVSIQK